MGQRKKRMSGLYLDEPTVEAVERLRRERNPIPTFNRQVLDLLHEILRMKGWLTKEGWYARSN